MGNKQSRCYLRKYDNMADKTGVLARNVAVSKFRPSSIVLPPSLIFFHCRNEIFGAFSEGVSTSISVI